ncbi:unnamed protein product [Adineta steineri]|uniref:G-protein coupled receptors family 1 profile domain-containing protein n=1 Tax=Adineta steineri TaxID=433720 RepID=A0A814UYV7_9BILA|nr:unnamed protein product [Adineta steineri]CAF1305183.1 unnamed protein product [Adineta steineri]CAF3645237.1 unnamed protein product [Adineta steineri]CAF3783392.1 unnamed protein product [Adineta steineri]
MTWSMMIFLIFGTIGNICNCFVFLQKSLRSNSCSHYLLISSIANTLALIFSISTGIYSVAQIDLTSYSLIFCKLRLYIYHTLLMISRYLIIIACIDRACVSSRRVSIRNFSQIHIARILSSMTIIIWFIATIHIPIMNTIELDYCIMPGTYSLIFSIYALIFAGIIPPVLMSIFSLITLHNLHLIHVRVSTTSTQINHRIRQRDFHLIRMLTAQVFVYILTTTPYPINTVYAAVTARTNKSMDRQAIESFIYFITSSFLLFINPAVSFYIYIATTKAFRKELKLAWINLRQKIFSRRQQECK